MSQVSPDSPSDRLPFTPVVIIGAGRSGTNALRDMLTRLPLFSTWACDEINPIWRHGNALWPTDEIPPECARPVVRRYIRRAFLRLWRQTGNPRFVVEKTCANSLRIPFVDAVLPEARYLYIVRDGTDVVASACRRWQGELEVPGLKYFMAKLRYAPLCDLPLYGFSFMKNRLALLFGGRRRLGTWGPQFAGMDNYVDAGLEELCARQWIACVLQSDLAFESIDSNRVLALRYEDLAAEPAATLSAILSFLDANAAEADIATAVAPITNFAVGKGRRLLHALHPEIRALMERPMRAHGYVR